MEPATSRKLSEALEQISARLDFIEAQQAKEEEQAAQIATTINKLVEVFEKKELQSGQSSLQSNGQNRPGVGLERFKENSIQETVAKVIYGAKITGQIITIVATGLQLIQEGVTRALAEERPSSQPGEAWPTTQHLSGLILPLSELIKEMTEGIKHEGAVPTAKTPNFSPPPHDQQPSGEPEHPPLAEAKESA